MHIRVFVAVLAIIVSGSIASARTPWVPLSIDEAGAIVVPVSINGRGPFRFLLDTGSTHSVISRSLAEDLNLESVARTSVVTSSGAEVRAVVKLDLTAIGAARSDQLLASVVLPAQLAVIRRDIDGIIGQDFLFAFNYTLDYRRRRLSWTSDTTSEYAARVPLVAAHGRYLARIGTDNRPVLLVPDSGASGFVIYSRGGRAPVPLEPLSQLISVGSLSGRQVGHAMVIRELRLGDLMVRNQPAAVVARALPDILEGDGLLPLHLFDSVSFDARDRQLTLRVTTRR